MKKAYTIKKIDCANCALKIEAEIKKTPGITQVHVDFAKEKIVVVGEPQLITAKQIEKIAQSVESDIRIYDIDQAFQYEEAKMSNNEWIMYGIGILIIFLAFLLTNINASVTITLGRIFFIIAYVIFGHKVIIKAGKNILRGQIFDEHFLMLIATLGALIIGEYIEAIAVMFFYRIGEYLQDMSVTKSRKDIKALMDIKPTTAHKLTAQGLVDTLPEGLLIGDIVVVRPGEKVPVDGIVTEGSSWLDTSSVTGESMPRDAYEGIEVISGSINLSGLIRVQVMKEYKDSTVYKILDFIENNQMKKAKTERFMTKFAKYYTPFVVLLALIVAFLVPFLLSVINEVTYFSLLDVYVKRALIFLVISCPCALVLSIPLSFFAGIGSSSRKGILFKSGSDLEALSSIEHFVFDKTGTLTDGKFSVNRIVSGDPELILEYAAHAEYHSNHPIATSIIEAYGKKPDDKHVLTIRELAGKGIRANYKGIHLLVGNDRLLDEYHINYMKTHEMGTIVYVAANHEFMGYIVIKDTVKASAKNTIQQLLKRHQVSMVSGDYESAAKDVSFQLGLDDYYANCVPEDKIRIVDAIKQEKKVCFIGDGINDAPVLATADVGIAMGGIGSDVAIEAADAVIMNDDPEKVLIAYQIARKTMRIVFQNIFLALGIKGIVLILGALGYASMWLAIFADVGVSILAVLNSMLIFRTKKVR